MNSEAHLAVGWILAHCGGRSETRRFRGIVTAAALASDVDVISYLFGERAYATFHHAAGHNVFFSILLSAVSVAVIDRRSVWRAVKIVLFTQLAFYSHYLGDYFFTRFPLEFLWPVSTKGFIHGYRIGLDHPINLVFGYLSIAVFVAMGILYKRTPLELISPSLDERVVNLLFRRRLLACHICGRGANERCQTCGDPVCMRHARMTRSFCIQCAQCQPASQLADIRRNR